MRIVVAMSGGVDSSTVAALLVAEGHEVIGVHMRLHDAEGGAGRCCGYDDALDARSAADQLGIPFYVANLKDEFHKAVVDDFVAEYRAGRTPNPCVRCNGVLKFRLLLARSLALGAEKMATGHYARLVDGRLTAAADPDKDQSYFLWPTPPEALARSMFPLGGLSKPEVRDLAQSVGLKVADKPDSQDVCFVPDGDIGRVVQSRAPDLAGAGPILDTSGREVGRHDGYFRYTIGQRRGLGVAAGTPRYVVGVDPAQSAVIIGEERDLAHGGLVARGAVWQQRPSPEAPVFARIRHRGALIPAHVGGGDTFEVRFDQAARAVTPGQSVVLYGADRATVLGGAIIERALPSATPA